MDREKALAKLTKLQKGVSPDDAHREADAVLCRLLTDLGYADIVAAWGNVPKWYS
jgi:hypothetical protein